MWCNPAASTPLVLQGKLQVYGSTLRRALHLRLALPLALALPAEHTLLAPRLLRRQLALAPPPRHLLGVGQPRRQRPQLLLPFLALQQLAVGRCFLPAQAVVEGGGRASEGQRAGPCPGGLLGHMHTRSGIARGGQQMPKRRAAAAPGSSQGPHPPPPPSTAAHLSIRTASRAPHSPPPITACGSDSCARRGRLKVRPSSSAGVSKWAAGSNAAASFSSSTNTVCRFWAGTPMRCSDSCSRSTFCGAGVGGVGHCKTSSQHVCCHRTPYLSLE